MNLASIFTEVVKAFVNETPIRYGELDSDTVGVSTKPHIMYFVPKDRFPFAPEKISTCTTDCKKLMPKETLLGILTGEVKIRSDSKITARKIACADIEVWVDVKALKNFSKHAEFRVVSSQTLVVVYEGDRIAGLIAPVRI